MRAGQRIAAFVLLMGHGGHSLKNVSGRELVVTGKVPGTASGLGGTVEPERFKKPLLA